MCLLFLFYYVFIFIFINFTSQENFPIALYLSSFFIDAWYLSGFPNLKQPVTEAQLPTPKFGSSSQSLATHSVDPPSNIEEIATSPRCTSDHPNDA
jgi:hypothetical protein